ncbi:MAG TPA: phosphoenolpyruvate carboxykinase (ATP) [Roseiflexaceae bacterium]|nr:phosphoenolpyruvate carboxykinase (ATP) [Roseiflexaceae bacterium]
MEAPDGIIGDLERLGIRRPGRVYTNLSPARLAEVAVIRGEGQLTVTGALAARTGKRTGRSPGDKFVVRYEGSRSAERVAWGSVNQPVSPQVFDRLRARVAAYLQGRDLFVLDALVGADRRYELRLRLVAELAWHALFARQLFRRPPPGAAPADRPDWTILAAPRFLADPALDDTKSETAVMLDVEQRMVLICGTEYAGEIKKSIFTVMNYLLPERGVLPMHCSANVGPGGDTALFFGLSGTGKTTLSADPERRLIGDDEHGWSDHGVFNIEGGCYAKCIGLSRRSEPQIYDAIRFGAVLENVVLDEATGEPDYADGSITENTRAAYPVEFIPGAEPSGLAGHPRTILFLAADAFGVLPPIARLTPEQARYHFLSGYTAKLAGTEVGLHGPEATFSTCFGAPFLPLAPQVYARMLGEKMVRHGVRVFLLNTGWSGGPYGVGQRIPLAHTRAMVRAAISGALDDVPTYTDPVFGLHVPAHVDGVPDTILHPRATWQDDGAYDARARELATRFVENFRRFRDVPAEVVDAGPRL